MELCENNAASLKIKTEVVFFGVFYLCILPYTRLNESVPLLLQDFSDH